MYINAVKLFKITIKDDLCNPQPTLSKTFPHEIPVNFDNILSWYFQTQHKPKSSARGLRAVRCSPVAQVHSLHHYYISVRRQMILDKGSLWLSHLRFIRVILCTDSLGNVTSQITKPQGFADRENKIYQLSQISNRTHFLILRERLWHSFIFLIF